jgi:hypothetical protein
MNGTPPANDINDKSPPADRNQSDELHEYPSTFSGPEDGPLVDPALADPPILAGSFIAWFVDRKYHGGVVNGDEGLVIRVTFSCGRWAFYTAGGWEVMGGQIYQVTPVDRDGRLEPPYYTKEQGLAGWRYRAQTAELKNAGVDVDARWTYASNAKLGEEATVAKQGDRGEACTHSRSARAEESSGTTRTATRFMACASEPSSDLNLLPRSKITVETVKGRQEIRAWIIGSLALHNSIAASGFSVTHVKSGRKIISRVATKFDSLNAAMRLEKAIDWSLAELRQMDLVKVGSLLKDIPRTLPWKSKPLSMRSRKESSGISVEKHWKRIPADGDALVRWESPGQTHEGKYRGRFPAGRRGAIVHKFVSSHGQEWKTFETYALRRALRDIHIGQYVRVTFEGFGKTHSTTKTFEVDYHRLTRVSWYSRNAPTTFILPSK